MQKWRVLRATLAACAAVLEAHPSQKGTWEKTSSLANMYQTCIYILWMSIFGCQFMSVCMRFVSAVFVVSISSVSFKVSIGVGSSALDT